MRDLVGLSHFKIHMDDSYRLSGLISVEDVKILPRVTKRRKIPGNRKKKKLLDRQKQNIREYAFKNAWDGNLTSGLWPVK
jgi:hypothetical protein